MELRSPPQVPKQPALSNWLKDLWQRLVQFVCPLDENKLVPVANLAPGAAGAGTFLQGDQTWGVPAGAGNVSVAAHIDDHAVVRGDGGAQTVQDSGILIDDANNVTGVATLDATALHATTGLFDHIGEHTGGHGLQVGNTIYMLAGADIRPATNNVNLGGGAGIGFDNLYLNTGAEIRWNAGDVVMTHAAGEMNFSGGDWNFVLGLADHITIDGHTTPNQTAQALEVKSQFDNGNGYGIYDWVHCASTTGVEVYGINVTVHDSAVKTGTNHTLIGVAAEAHKTGADTNADTTTVVGVDGYAIQQGSTAVGTHDTYGGYFTAVGDAAGTSTTYGVYGIGTGADTNWGGYFEGNVGIEGVLKVDHLAELTGAHTIVFDSAVDISSGHVHICGTKTVDETDIGDGKILQYNAGTGNLEYEALAAGHVQGTDTGTTGNTFTIDSDSVTGKIILDVALGAADKSLTITNTALTDDRTATFKDESGTVAYMTDMSVGQCRNIGIAINQANQTVTIQGAQASLSATNPGYICVPDTTAGLTTVLTFTADVTFDFNNYTSGNQGCGITESVDWTSDMPWFLYCINDDNTDASASFCITRNPRMSQTPAEGYFHYTDADAATDDQTSVFVPYADGEDKSAKPCVCIGSIRMQWTTAEDEWHPQTLNNYDGIGKFQEGIQFTMPLGQNGAQTGTYAPKPANNSPVFTTNTYTYEINRQGYVDFDLYQTGDGGNDGSDATIYYTVLPLSYAGTSGAYIYGPAYQIGAGASSYSVLAFSGSSAANFSLRSLSSTSSVNYNAFTNGNRSLVVRGSYQAF